MGVDEKGEMERDEEERWSGEEERKKKEKPNLSLVSLVIFGTSSTFLCDGKSNENDRY